MRLPVSIAIASLIVALLIQHSLAIAQDNVNSSTIRLTSAAEPVADRNLSADSAPQPLAPPIVHTPVEPPSANKGPKMPAGFYASAEARSTLNQMPGPAPVQSAPRVQPNRRGGKPFQAIQTQPTISPYLYLNAGTNTSNPTTNYFAFVRPQMEQQEAGRQQQREIQQLRSQLQKMSSTGASSQQAGNPNAAAHYMDTAQFYRGLQR